MTRILAIDPGSERSAWVFLEDGRPWPFGIYPNEELLECLRKPDDGFATFRSGVDVVVIEEVRSFMARVGREVFETVRWAGRFEEAAQPTPVSLLGRKEVVSHLTGTARGGDGDVRAALIDRFGGIGGKAAAIGTKAAPGPLYGIAKDVWSSLAIAVTYLDQLGADR